MTAKTSLQALLSIINTSNPQLPRPLNETNCTLSAPSALSTADQTTYGRDSSVVLTPVAGYGFTADPVTLYYNRVDLADVLGTGNANFNWTNETQLSQLLTQINTRYGVNLQADDYVEQSLPANPGDGSTKPITLTSTATSLAFKGSMTLGLVFPMPSITFSRAAPDQREYTTYDFYYGATGGTAPYTYALANGTTLPAGLAMDSAGHITGTANTRGTFSWQIKVTDAKGASATLSDSIVLDYPLLTFDPSVTTGFLTGSTYGVIVSASGGTGTYTYTTVSGTMPPGMSLINNGNSLKFSGTPTTAGSYTMTIQVTSSDGQSVTTNFYLTVAASYSTLAFVGGYTSALTRGTAINQSIGTTGGNGHCMFSVISGTMPPGLHIAQYDHASYFAVQGTPTTAGTYTFTVQAHSGDGQNATKTITYTVS